MRRGNQSRGAVIWRPSFKRTASFSAVTCTSATRLSALIAKILMPCTQKIRFAFCHFSTNFVEIVVSVTAIEGQSDRHEPELARPACFVDVDVRWFVSFVAEEVEAITVPSQDRRHRFALPAPTPHIHKVALKCCRRGHDRRDQMRAAFVALAAFEVAVGGRGAALLGL